MAEGSFIESEKTADLPVQNTKPDKQDLEAKPVKTSVAYLEEHNLPVRSLKINRQWALRQGAGAKD